MKQSVTLAALSVLNTAPADEKAAAARSLAGTWQGGELLDPSAHPVPDRPARPEKPVLLAPADMPKRRKGGNIANRIALLHAVAHIELNAIDLATDIVARFGHVMPRDFVDDWVQVADDEARHFGLLQTRLRDFDSFYGALPAHDGLWQASYATRNDIAARLAVVPMVLEARGLDVTPGMIKRLDSMGDIESADCLRIIYDEEVRHVAFGTKWFHFVADRYAQDRESLFQDKVKTYFHGLLKPPFNHQARDAAGLPKDYYEPLAEL